MEFARGGGNWPIYTHNAIGVPFRPYSKHLKRYVSGLPLKLTMQRLPARSGSFSTYFGGGEAYLMRILMMVVVFSANPIYLTLDPPASALHYQVDCITR